MAEKTLELVYFTQTDPIGLRGGANLYGYAAGDPVNLRDPFGLWPSAACWKAIAGAAISIGLDAAGAGALRAAGRLAVSAGRNSLKSAAGTLLVNQRGMRGAHFVEFDNRVAIQAESALAERQAGRNIRDAGVTLGAETGKRAPGAELTADEDDSGWDVLLDAVPIIGSLRALQEVDKKC